MVTLTEIRRRREVRGMREGMREVVRERMSEGAMRCGCVRLDPVRGGVLGEQERRW